MRPLISLLLIGCLASLPAASANYQIFTLRAGRNTQIFYEVNTSGTVFLKIESRDGAPACANFWWITIPWGKNKDLGHQCGQARFEIPGFPHFGSRLRVGGADEGTRVLLTTEESVANSILTIPQ